MKPYLKVLTALTAVLLLNSCSANKPETAEPTVIISPEAKYDYATDTALPAAAETEPPEVIAPIETARISFLAAGDNLIHPCIYMDARDRATAESRPYNFRPMYEDAEDFIASFDIAFINQETPLGGDDLGFSGYPAFNSPRDLGRDLRDIGFDIVNIAHNHMLDKGEAGLRGTIEFFDSEEMAGVIQIGGYKNRDDYDAVRVIERDGIKIALLSYTYGTNGVSLKSSSELVVPYINDDDMIRQCAIAEESGDITVVSVHWGVENTTEPTEEQRRIAKLLADNGADVILGHHPHVLQPIEWISAEDGSESLCIYSLGNLVSAMMYWENMVGGFFIFDIVQMSDGTVYIDSPEFVPTAFFYGPSYYNSHLYFLRDYPEDVAKKHGTGKLYRSPAAPHDMVNFVERLLFDYLVLDPDAARNQAAPAETTATNIE